MRSIFERSSIFHPRDAEMFRVGGLFAGRRFFNDPPAYEAQALDDTFRASDPALKDFKTVGALRKAYLDTKTFVGESIRIPKADATPEQRAEFRDRLRKADPDLIEIPKDEAKRKEVVGSIWETLGRPKDEKGYGLEGVQLDGVAFSEEELATLRKAATKRGYTVEQWKTFLEDVVQERVGLSKAEKERAQALRTEFGLAYDDRMKELAVIAEKTGAPQVLRDSIAKGQIDPGTAKWLLAQAQRLGVDAREVATQTGRKPVTMTPDEARAEQRKIMDNPAYLNPGKDPDEHKRLVQRAAELDRFIYPELAAE